VAGCVRGEHSGGVDSRQRDVDGSRDMRAKQISLHITDGDLAAASLQIQSRPDRNLNFEVHITDISAISNIGNDVDYQTRICLPRIEMNGGSFHRSGDLDFIA